MCFKNIGIRHYMRPLTAAALVLFSVLMNAAPAFAAYGLPEESVIYIADGSEITVGGSVTQAFVVTGTGGANAEAVMYEKDIDGNWNETLRTNAYVGSGGIGLAQEGAATTPEGTFRFTMAFGINSDPGCTAFPYYQVTGDDYWSGDARPGYGYNTMVRLSDYPDLDIQNSEHLIDCVGFYAYCLNISYNEACVPGDGSAFFLHCINPSMPYTEGCVAIPEEDMVYVLQHVQQDCAVVIRSV